MKRFPLLLTASALLLSACFGFDGGPSQHPTDAELVANFHAHRSEFESLLHMFLEDKDLGRVGDGFTRPDDPTTVGVSAQRIAEYHRIFDRLGLRDGIEGYDRKEMVWFHASSMGLAISGSSKGYVWTTDDPGEMVDDTDAFRPDKPVGFTVYRKIDENWYIELDYEE